MFLNSSKLLFLIFMTVGVMVSLSCNSWIMVWSGMELFLLSFVPYFCSYSFVSSECSMSYFLIQGFSSSLFIFSFIFLLMSELYLLKSIMCFSLLLKLGCAPFHMWVLGVVSGMSYDSLFIFFSFSKLPPFFLLSYISYNLFLFILLSLFFGSVGGLNHSSLSSLLGFSSVFNMGFLMYLFNLSSLWFFYFFCYCLMVLFVLYFLYFYNFIYLNHIFIGGFDLFMSISFWVLFLSLGGIPPMFGFFVSLISIELSLMMMDYLISFFMVIFSLIVLFYYMRCSFLSLILFSFSLKWNFYLLNGWLFFFSLFSVIIFPFCFLLKGLI
uniref:NADH-ubiquinone oxidoreductase chain 2 n=1 Tax=Petalocephala chlorophana TaxID=2501810 RepID=A0A7L8XEY0_9HEMI|nr:NADH dehydrogenase subunit 2 [Petalocephala chlorophana]QOH91212.1 NADH dehydrogenase subunit 2 [Petalocephala chlorophana]